VQIGKHGDGTKTIDAAWSRDGKWLATTSEDQRPSQVLLWRGDGSPPRMLSATNEPIRSLVWHPESERFTTISNGKIQHWNLEGKEGGSIEAFGSHILWSPDGKWLAVPAKSRIYVYDVDNQEIANFVAPVAYDENHVAWSPDSSRLLTQTKDGVHVHDLKNTQGVELNGRCLEGLAAWSPDGAKIACTTRFNTMIVWDATTGQVEWVGLPLENAKSATVAADGRLFTDDRDAFDKRYCFVMKDAEGKTVFLNSKEFEAAINRK
jgi:WD40 repeat protein